MNGAFAALEALPRWVGWREEVRGSVRALPTKVPYDPNASGADFGYGNSIDPTSWGTHAQAAARAQQLDDGRKVGCGIVLGDLGDNTYLSGADLDSSLDENGALASWVVRIVDALQTYAEISPSGRGLKTFFRIPAGLVRWFLDLIGVEKDSWGCKRGIPGLDGADHGPGVEIYTSARYFTVTGRIWSIDYPHIVTLDRDQLAALAELIPSPSDPSASPGSAGDTSGTSGPSISAPRNSRDNSRSARAARIAVALMPDTYDEMVKGLREHTSDDIKAWVQDKGEAHEERELKRIWKRIAAKRAEGRLEGLADLAARTGTPNNIEPDSGGPEPEAPRGNGHDPKAEEGRVNPSVGTGGDGGGAGGSEPPRLDGPGPGGSDEDEEPGAGGALPPPRRTRKCPPAMGREEVFARETNWAKKLLRTARGSIRPCLANAIIALRHAPEWDDRLWFDMFHNRVVLRGVPPWSNRAFDDEPWSDLFDNLATDWMQHRGIMVSHEIVGRAVWTVAHDQWFHPVRQYLGACRRAWDGQKRVFNWPTTYLGTPYDTYSTAIGQRWLLSPVARVMEPGCKADSALVLEGLQGIFKSEFFRRLGWPWVTDDMGGSELGSKDAALQVAGIWIMELAELDQHTTGRDVAKTKSFMSRPTDRFRPPYGTHPLFQPRQCVFGCTTNKSEYLPDETGNRRWWPLVCTAVDLVQLDNDRDQLFGEAVALYEAGELWWLDTPELNALAGAEQDKRYVPDSWDALISHYVDYRTREIDDGRGGKTTIQLPQLDSVTVPDILADVLELPVGMWGQREENRVAKSLRRLGWVRRQKRVERDREWRYFRPEEDGGEPPEDA